MAGLIERLRAAREQIVEIDGIRLRVRRPTYADLAYVQAESNEDFLRRCVVGWVGVREVDIVPGGAAHEVPFDADVCIEWFKDAPQRWVSLNERVSEIVRQYLASLGDAEKK